MPTRISWAKRIALWLLAVVGAVCAAGYFLVATPFKADNFGFLGGRVPSISGVLPNIEDGRRSSAFADEYRIYSWQQSYSDVKTAADREFGAIGFKHNVGSKGYVSSSWEGPNGLAVYMEPTRSRNRREVWDGKSTHEPGWVTVIVTNPIPDTWVNHLRYALEPSDH